eukprot:1598131-Rhodomonas_salina.2
MITCCFSASQVQVLTKDVVWGKGSVGQVRSALSAPLSLSLSRPASALADPRGPVPQCRGGAS